MERQNLRELLIDDLNNVTMDTQLHTLRADLEEIERRLIPLLVTVQRALGKEPTIPGRGEKGLTRAERRRR